MNRVEDNLRLLDDIFKMNINPERDRNLILMDISKSLSVIADALASKEVDNDDTHL